MEKYKKIYLLRHGTTDYNKCYIGASDIDLSDAGKKEIKDIAPFIATQKIEQVYCSPMRRCLQTQEQLRLPIGAKLEYNLREIDFGRWEGKDFAEIAASDPQLVTAWSQKAFRFTFPEGENTQDFIQRVQQVTDKILSDNATNILLISHGGVIRSMICSFLGINQDKALQFAVEPSSLTVFKVYKDGGGVLCSLGMTG
jgi:alpha-ribazole phosphatase